MAVGEYVSVSSQSDAEKAYIMLEKKDLLENPDYELDELAREYMKQGVSKKTAHQVARELTKNDELRDIMSRMIGAEIRYTQVGYWMRQPPFGYMSEKIETRHGKRTVLKPHPEEAPLIRKLYELKALGTMSDRQIVDKMNTLGFRTRKTYTRDNNDRSKIIGTKGGNPLEMTKINRYLENPIYAGVVKEKWTNDKPINAAFDGLVSFELYNQANRSRVALHESADGDIEYEKVRPDEKAKKGVRNDEFAYRRFVACPTCNNPLLGSASRSKMGKYYPAYHCSNHGHYFRVPKDEMENRIMLFVKQLKMEDAKIEALMQAVRDEYERRLKTQGGDAKQIDAQIAALRGEISVTLSKIKFLSSPSAIAYIESDVEAMEKKIQQLEQEKSQMTKQKPLDIEAILKKVRYLLEHIDELLLKQANPVRKAQLFGALFNQLPTYDDLNPGTQKTPLFTGVNSVFRLASFEKSLMVIVPGIEPGLSG
jgi:hypothetical protein